MLGNKCIASRVILGQVRRVLVVKLLFFEAVHGEDAGPPGYEPVAVGRQSPVTPLH